MKNTLKTFILVLALCASSAYAQLSYAPIATPTLFANMKADASFVNNTLLNLGTFAPVPDFDGQLHSFTFGGLTFNNIPNLDPTSPSDIQVGPGFFADVTFLAKDSIDTNNFGSESNLIGAGNQVIFAGYGAGSTQSTRITGLSLTDVVFWHQDASWDNIKYTMDNPLHFTTFTASTATDLYYIFGIDDRGTMLQDFDDGVLGVRLNLQPVGVVPVPEASTYGLIGAALMAVVVAVRRVRNKAEAVG